MKTLLLISFSTIITQIATAQSLSGKWTDERDWHIHIQYVFNYSGEVYTKRRWDMGQ